MVKYNLHFAWLCDTPRPFVHRFAIGTATGSSFSPLREGMATQYIVCQTIRYITIHPDRNRDIPSRRGVPEGRGVSHYIDILYNIIKTFSNLHQCIVFLISYLITPYKKISDFRSVGIGNYPFGASRRDAISNTFVYNIVAKCIVHFNSHFNFLFNSLLLLPLRCPSDTP